LYTQQPYRYRLDWGRRGVQQAVEQGNILVIVDTLRFSTAAITATHHGSLIYPCSLDEDAAALARRIGGEVAVSRVGTPDKGRFSLSPATYFNIEPGTKVVLASPNGATCSRYGSQVPYLFIGALVNARAAAMAVSSLAAQENLAVTVIACGERWKTPSEGGVLRIAIEDYLGAGAILSYVQGEKSPEAHVCAGAFVQVRDELEHIIWDCGSGRELREKGLEDDVKHAARLNLYQTVPYMRGDHLEPYMPLSSFRPSG
jgi:2-phosphosulfolactate phosphatase